MTQNSALIPAQFRSLEPYVKRWALATMAERHRSRTGSTDAERGAFYAAAAPQLEAIIDYLRPLPLQALSPEALRLLRLSLALAEVSLTREVYTPDYELRHAAASRKLAILREMDGL